MSESAPSRVPLSDIPSLPRGTKEVREVCYTCGCRLPFEDHGDPRNLTERHLREATQTKVADGADIAKVKQNILELVEAQKTGTELATPRDSYAEKNDR